MSKRENRLHVNHTHYCNKREVINLLGGKCHECGVTLEDVGNWHGFFVVFSKRKIKTITEGNMKECRLTRVMRQKLMQWRSKKLVELLCLFCHEKVRMNEQREKYTKKEWDYLMGDRGTMFPKKLHSPISKLSKS